MSIGSLVGKRTVTLSGWTATVRILHYYKTSYPDTYGGVEQMIHQLCRAGNARGISHHVLSLGALTGRPHTIEGYTRQVVRRDFSIASTDVSRASLGYFRAEVAKADIVHFHFPWPFADLAHLLNGGNRPSLVTYHSDIVRQRKLLSLYRPLKHRFLGSVDRIVATSPNYLATSDVLARYRLKTDVIPIGLDPTTYPVPSAAKLAEWRRRVGDRFFLFVGVLRYYKGLHILLEALRNIDLPVVIVGSGPIESELRRLASEYRLRNTRFLGILPEVDKAALLTLCNAVVFPSHLRSEAFGISLLEGAMFGKPMISSEIGTGTTYINEAGITGLVVPPSDPTALQQAMQLLWQQPDVARDMGLRAEARFSELFTANTMADSYARVYREILEKRGR